MIDRKTYVTSAQRISGALSLLVMSCAVAQSSQTSGPMAPTPFLNSVSLASGTCPAVHAGDAIAMDWNPGFDPTWAVTGIRDVAMSFTGLTDAGTVNPRIRLNIFRGAAHRFTSLGNGYFHVEVQIPSQAASGTYQLSSAYAIPETRAEYQGELPQTRVSPAREHLCVTVLPSTRASSRTGTVSEEGPPVLQKQDR